MDARKDQIYSILVHMDRHQQTQTIFWKSEVDKPWCLLAWAYNRWELSMAIYLTATFWRVLWRAIILDVSRYCLVKEMVKKVRITFFYYGNRFSNLGVEDWCCRDQQRSYLARGWPFYLFCLEWLNSGGNFSEFNVEEWNTNKRRKMFWLGKNLWLTSAFR